MDFNKQIFNDLRTVFNENGFRESKYFINNGGLEYYKITSESIHWIRLVFALNNNAFVQINSYISFPLVTKVLQKFTSIKEDFIEEIVKNNYIDSEWHDLMKHLCSLPLKTEDDKKALISEIVQHVDDYILPFFNKIPNLQAVNEEILNNVKEEEYASYIPGQTNFKVLIIMKLCNNPKYEEFKNWALDAYKRGAEMDAVRYDADYKSLLSLVYYLDSQEFKTC